MKFGKSKLPGKWYFIVAFILWFGIFVGFSIYRSFQLQEPYEPFGKSSYSIEKSFICQSWKRETYWCTKDEKIAEVAGDTIYSFFSFLFIPFGLFYSPLAFYREPLKALSLILILTPHVAVPLYAFVFFWVGKIIKRFRIVSPS